jgi:hypothetical protein
MGLAEVVDGHHAPKSFPTYAETDVTEDSNVPNADDIEYRTNCTMEEIAKGVSLQYQGDEHNFAVTSRIPSPLTIDHTSHHYLDPFHTYPSNLSRETITRTFHYCRYPPLVVTGTLLIIYRSPSRNVAQTLPRSETQRQKLHP